MLNKFKSKAVSGKIKLGVRYLVFIIIGLSISSVLSLSFMGISFNSFRSISSSTNLMGRIQANILEARLSALKFIRTGKEADVNKFNERIDKSKRFINEALLDLNEEDQFKILSSIKDYISKYANGFNEVVKIKKVRNKIVYDKLNLLGPQLEKLLTKQIRLLSDNKQTSSAFEVSMSLRSLMLARLYQSKFLDTNAKKDYDRVLMEFRDFDAIYGGIKKNINIVEFDKVWQLKENYISSFRELNNTIIKRNEIISSKLDYFGPLIAKYSEDIKLKNKGTQEYIGNKINMILIFIVSFFVIISVCSYYFGRFISSELLKASSELKNSINTLIDKISKSYNEIMSLNTKLLSSSDSIDHLVDEQKSASQQTASAATETTETVKGVQKLVKESNDFSNKIKNNVDQASSKMNGLVNAMKDIEGSNIKIQNLSNMMKEVSEKIGVIDDIVFQTKLLSFNASVEAARAGENGKGFSVVAEEIGNLASMSGNSAAEISEIISRNSQEVDTIVLENSKNVQRGIEFVEATSNKLKEIILNTDSNLTSMKSIMVSANEQSSAVSEITLAINSLDQGTSNLSQLSNQNKNIVNELNTEASELDSSLSLLSGLTDEESKAA